MELSLDLVGGLFLGKVGVNLFEDVAVYEDFGFVLHQG